MWQDLAGANNRDKRIERNQWLFMSSPRLNTTFRTDRFIPKTRQKLYLRYFPPVFRAVLVYNCWFWVLSLFENPGLCLEFRDVMMRLWGRWGLINQIYCQPRQVFRTTGEQRLGGRGTLMLRKQTFNRRQVLREGPGRLPLLSSPQFVKQSWIESSLSPTDFNVLKYWKALGK